MRLNILLGATFLSALAGSAKAQEITWAGEIWLDNRLFFEEPLFNDQEDFLISPSIAGLLEAGYVFPSGQDSLGFTGFYRADADDNNRTHGDIREAFWLHQDDGWDVLLGVNQVFWGSVESHHLVNIVNQTDYVEDISGDEFLGQPMANLSVFGEWGTLDLYYLPHFRERTYASLEGRFSLPISITDDANYESDLEKWHQDFAARLRMTHGAWDFAVSHFYGTSREQRYSVVLDQPIGPGLPPEVVDIINEFLSGNIPDVDAADGLAIADDYISLKPNYDIINQTGFEAVGVYEQLIMKFEGFIRFGQGDPFFATVVGLEYTFTNVEESGIDLGLIAEYNYDGRGDYNDNFTGGSFLDITEAPITIYNNDAFFGVRTAFNDESSSSLLVGALVDLELGSVMLNLEYERRLADFAALEVTGRLFPFVDDEDILQVYKNDSYIEGRLRLFF